MDQYLFFILLGIPAEYDAKFNAVYDTDHLLHMTRIPGVRDAMRYKLEWSDNADMLPYLVLYRIDDPELPRSDIWKEHAAMGDWATQIRPHVTGRRNGVYRQLFHAGDGAPDSNDCEYIYFLQQSVPPDLDGKFNQLYNTDHVPLMLQAPGVASCTRYKLHYTESGDVPDYLAVYAIAGADTPRSPQWKMQTGRGAWPTQIRPHFTARRNGVYRRTGVFTAR
ncbi:MAG TPA: hypothetical protein VL048_09225 [Xanthobacteraceae bacterium]|nr:hypothetical protein [Xanthobacteraceae bacterium]